MHLFVGLGNPGNQYAQTRHNAGFVVIDYLFDVLKGKPLKQTPTYSTASISINDNQIMLLKPLTYMNLSGKAVKKVIDDIKYTDKEFDPSKNMFVIHDDVDIAPGVIKIKNIGSSAGHNGVQDIISSIGNDFLRLRIGVGRPNGQDTADYVLQRFTSTEWDVLVNDVCPIVDKFFHEFFLNGLVKAMNCLSKGSQSNTTA